MKDKLSKKEICRRVWLELDWDTPKRADIIQKNIGLGSQRTAESVRFACKDLVMKYGLPVVSNDDGFFKTVHPEAMIECAMNYFKRADSINERGRKLLRLGALGWGGTAFDSAFADEFEGGQEHEEDE